MEYGEKISRLRKLHGMTQEELGKILNVTYQAVSKWERGESLPDFATMSQIARYFQVPLSYFEDGGELLEDVAPVADTVAEVQQKPDYIGICASCGKLITEEEAYTVSPKILCKPCVERYRAQKAEQQKEEERHARYERERHRAEVRGGGFDVKLIISLALLAVSMILFTVIAIANKNEADMYSFLLFFIPLTVFGLTGSVIDFINDLRDKDDESGYTLPLSLIVGGAVAVVFVVLQVIVYAISGQSFCIIMAVISAILSFTFISQYMWGSVVPEIFSCGGFTFKLPGFIFSLTVDSILWMIITKVILGFLSILVYIATTVIFAVAAIVGSVFTFIPCIIFKIARDKAA